MLCAIVDDIVAAWPLCEIGGNYKPKRAVMMFDPARYFIHGNSTIAASDGMARSLVVCPAHGADWFAVYVHSDEVARLRKALEKIANPLALDVGGGIGFDRSLKMINAMQDIAKDALNITTGTPENK